MFHNHYVFEYGTIRMHDPPRSRNNPPGYDQASPYEGEDLQEYPDWWRESIKEFREHGMRPYRPPRFSDGEMVPRVVEELESHWDVEILFRAVNPSVGDDWEIQIDGVRVAEISRERRGDGYTVYEIDTSTFALLVLNAESSTDGPVI